MAFKSRVSFFLPLLMVSGQLSLQANSESPNPPTLTTSCEATADNNGSNKARVTCMFPEDISQSKKGVTVQLMHVYENCSNSDGNAVSSEEGITALVIRM
jgi:hypothetical protein